MAVERVVGPEVRAARTPSRRLWEVDSLRGFAIVGMVVFHALYDLNAFGSYAVNLQSGFWHYFEQTIAALFIALVGVSLVLSSSRARQVRGTGPALFAKYVRRGLTVFAWGLGITAVTWVLMPEEYVRFGILHLIGVSIVLKPSAEAQELLASGAIDGSSWTSRPRLWPVRCSM